MKNDAAIIIGMAQEMAGAPAALVPCVRAVRDDLARLAQLMEEMQDVEDGDD